MENDKPSLTDKIETAMQGSLNVQLPPGEALVKQGVASWQISKFKIVNVDVFLTNQRLLTQDNLATIAAVSVGGAVGGGLGGGLASAGASGAGAGAAASSRDGGFAISLADITGITIEKYKAFGLIPGRYPFLVFATRSSDTPIKLMFTHHEEWLQQIQQLIQPSAAQTQPADTVNPQG